MTKEQFVRNNRGIDDGHDLPREYLEQVGLEIHATKNARHEFLKCSSHVLNFSFSLFVLQIYDRIVAEPFRNLGDNTTVLERMAE